jgi:hypothetical protein
MSKLSIIQNNYATPEVNKTDFVLKGTVVNWGTDISDRDTLKEEIVNIVNGFPSYIEEIKELREKAKWQSSYELAQILDASFALGSMQNLENNLTDIEDLRDFVTDLFEIWRQSVGVEGIFKDKEEEGYFTPFVQRIVREKGCIPFDLTELKKKVIF